jgi:predicted aldo/keto reductase-like oxidoreductase
MKTDASRRSFLVAGLTAPAALGSASQSLPAKTSTPKLQSGPKLEFRTLGKTGLKVTSVGFGCMITSDGTVIERAADMGINYFDTARGYQSGNCERMVGAALKNYRKKVILSTKSQARNKAGLMEHLETSLRELQTDYVDIWYLHAKSRPEDVNDEMLEAQVQAKKEGKARFAGISTHAGQKELVPHVIGLKHFDVLLTSYNFAMDPAMDTLIGDAAKAGLGIVAMKVMAGGQRRSASGGSEKTREILGRDGAMLAALKWALKNRNVHTTIPSITDIDQLDENLGAMGARFTTADEKILSARLELIRPDYCRMCGTCTGTCSQGLPVADILRFLMYADSYGEFALGLSEYRGLPAEVASVRCSDCSDCSVRCPNGVQVVLRLSRAQECFA